MRRRLPDIGIFLLLLALPLLMFWQQTVGGKTLIPTENLYQYQPYAAYREQVGAPALPYNALVSDLVLQNYQFKSFIRESLAQGEIPLWNPYQFSGIPFFAAGQQSTLYPFSIIYYVLPLAAAYGWFMVSQLWLAGIFMVLFLRGLGIGRVGALVAGVTYQLSAFFVISAVFPMIVAAAVWLPLILLMIEFTIQQRPALRGIPASVPWVAIGAIALGCCVLAGHVEITYYTLLVSAYYTAARLLYILWQSRSRPSSALSTSQQVGTSSSLRSTSVLGTRYSVLRFTLTRGLAVVVMVAFGMSLGAVQFIPTVEAAQNNFRSDTASLQQVLDWAHPLRDVVQFVMPNFYGNPSHHSYFDVFTGQTISLTDTPTLNAENNPLTTIDWGMKNYVEAALYVGILPLALAIYGLLRRRTLHQIILALLGIASLTFMFGLPTYALLYLLPGINQLHSPFRWVFPLTLCIAALAGFGMDSLLSSEKSRWTRRFGIALTGVGVLSLVGLAASRLFYAQVAPLVERVFTALALATRAFTNPDMFYSYTFANVLIFGVITLLSGLVFLYVSPLSRHWRGVGGEVIGRRALSIGAVALIAADLMLASYSFNPASDPALLDFTPPSIAWLQQQPGEWRYTTYEDSATVPHLMNANITMRYDLRDIRGYESIIPKPYVELMEQIAPQVQLEYNRIAPFYTSYADGTNPQVALNSGLINVLSVRYIVSGLNSTLPPERYALAYEDEAVRIWENNVAQPMAIARRLNSRALPATITSDTGRERFIDVQIPDDDPTTLIVNENYDPGWRAFIRPLGGEESQETQVEVTPTAFNMQLVVLPAPGDWTVRLVYSPASFQIGLFASFIGGILVLLAVGIWLWRLFVGTAQNTNATLRVARNSIAPILLNLFNRGIDMAFAFVMLRMLGPTDAGWYFYAGIIFVWFDIFTNFGLNLYLTREVSRDRSRAGHLFFNTSAMRIGLALLGVPLLLGFLFVRQETVTPPINEAALIAILVLYLGLLPNSLSTGLTALYYAFERAEVPAAVATAATICKSVFGLVALIGGFGIIGLAAVSIITNIVTLALLGWNGRDMIREGHEPGTKRTIDRPLIRRMGGESWFLMLNHFLATIFFQIDVIIIEAMHGARMVGQYSVAYKWVAALNIIPSFFTQALLPLMSRQAHEDRPGLKRNYILAIKLLVSTALPVAVIFTFIADFLAGALGGAQYLPDGAIATQLMIWSIPIGWMNSLTQYVLIALDMQRRILRAFVLAVSFNIITNLIFIPQYGYRAAALTTIASEAVLFLPFARLLTEAMGELPWLSMIWKQVAAAAAMFGVLAVGWAVQPALAIGVGLMVYGGLLLLLKLFNHEETARLLPLIPARLRRAIA